MTTIRVKKKLIKMGGWDGEVEIKELKKKIFHQLISCSDLTRKHSSCETQWGQNLYEIAFEFSRNYFTRFFPPFFIIMNGKALIEKKISWNQGGVRIEMRLQNGYDPIVPRDFLQKRHLRQSHCKMSIPTFVHTVVLSLLTFIKIRLAQMLWYFGFILTFFPSKRLGVKEAFQKGF